MNIQYHEKSLRITVAQQIPHQTLSSSWLSNHEHRAQEYFMTCAQTHSYAFYSTHTTLHSYTIIHVQTHNLHTHTLVNPNLHAKHNQLSQNPLTGVVATELEKFYLRTFCLFVAIVSSFWFCVFRMILFLVFLFLHTSNQVTCSGVFTSGAVVYLTWINFIFVFFLTSLQSGEVR